MRSGSLAPAIEVLYWAGALGLPAVGAPWNGALLLAGGQVGLLAALEWSIVLGCALSVMLVVSGRRGMRERRAPAKARVERSGRLSRSRFGWRSQVGAAALTPAVAARCAVCYIVWLMRRLIRDVSSVLIISGLLLVVDAGVTLLWQEPVTA